MIQGLIILHLMTGGYVNLPAGNLFPTVDICQEQGEHFGPKLLEMWNKTVEDQGVPSEMKATHFEIVCRAEV